MKRSNKRDETKSIFDPRKNGEAVPTATGTQCTCGSYDTYTVREEGELQRRCTGCHKLISSVKPAKV